MVLMMHNEDERRGREATGPGKGYEAFTAHGFTLHACVPALIHAYTRGVGGTHIFAPFIHFMKGITRQPFVLRDRNRFATTHISRP